MSMSIFNCLQCLLQQTWSVALLTLCIHCATDCIDFLMTLINENHKNGFHKYCLTDFNNDMSPLTLISWMHTTIFQSESFSQVLLEQL